MNICEYCKKEFIGYKKVQRFCNFMCQRKHYNRRPEIKEKYRLRMKKYRKNNPKWREYHRLQQARHKEKRALYRKEYFQRPEVKDRMNKNERQKLKNNPEYNIASRLRKALRHALIKYSSTGKIKKSRNYGIDWKEIIESLKPFPIDIKDYEIDHITPLCAFDLNKDNDVKEAFSPKNLQWLTKRENRSKGGKL